MNFQVVLEKRLRLETLVRTLRAEKGFRRAVLRHQVQVQLGDLVEPPRALIAYVLLGFVVRFHVVVQVGHLEWEKWDIIEETAQNGRFFRINFVLTLISMNHLCGKL